MSDLINKLQFDWNTENTMWFVDFCLIWIELLLDIWIFYLFFIKNND
jgi:hypothetical protein